MDDEPQEKDFHAVALVTDLLKTATPDALVYNNIKFMDVSPEFLDTYLSTAKPDMLMTDTYPYFKSTKPAWYPENPFLRSTDVRFVPNKGHSTPAGLLNWSKGAGDDKHIKGITLATPTHDKQDALIGFFSDENGHQYFMIQNIYRAPSLSAGSATSMVTINLAKTGLPSPGIVYRLDRTTGKSLAVHPMNRTELRDTLPGDTADLYSYTPFDLSTLQR